MSKASRGTFYVHHRNDRIYVCLGKAQAKFNEDWEEGVMYREATGNNLYVRPTKDFEDKFIKIDRDYNLVAMMNQDSKEEVKEKYPDVNPYWTIEKLDIVNGVIREITIDFKEYTNLEQTQSALYWWLTYHIKFKLGINTMFPKGSKIKVRYKDKWAKGTDNA